MGYKLYSNVTGPNVAEGATENIRGGLHYYEMYPMQNITCLKNLCIQITR